jgi:hypothetical protein
VSGRVSPRRTTTSTTSSGPEHPLQQPANGAAAADRARQQVAEIPIIILALIELGEIAVRPRPPTVQGSIDCDLGPAMDR